MKKILIIEDDPIVARIYQGRLEKEGYQVQIATDGQSGYYRIFDIQPDAIMLDLMLPKMNGVEVLRKIRSQAQFQKVPIIVFTNAYVPNMIQEAFQAGASQVFNKATLTPRQVLDALQTAIFLSSGNVSTPTAQDASPAPAATSQDTSHVKTFQTHDPFQTNPSHAAPPSFTAHVHPAASPDQDAEAEFSETEDIQDCFQDSAPEILGAIRKLMQDFTKANDEATRMSCLLELYRKVHSLTGASGIAGLQSTAQMSSALEVLLRELHEKPKNINVSTMRTVAHAIDFIGEIFTKGADRYDLLSQSINILVVDDEILSRRAITYALDKAGLKSFSLEDPHLALKMASEKAYDLIFLDIQMPGMDGFELCTQIRAGSENKLTPVVFVTSLSDFKSRARSSLSGGNDLIAKPFMFMELSVKALTYVLRGRLARLSEGNGYSQQAAVA